MSGPAPELFTVDVAPVSRERIVDRALELAKDVFAKAFPAEDVSRMAWGMGAEGTAIVPLVCAFIGALQQALATSTAQRVQIRITDVMALCAPRQVPMHVEPKPSVN